MNKENRRLSCNSKSTNIFREITQCAHSGVAGQDLVRHYHIYVIATKTLDTLFSNEATLSN
jgi:5'(3')-deoxyribonucleotidase